MIPLLLYALAVLDSAFCGFRAAAGRCALIDKGAYYARAMARGALWGHIAVAIASCAIALALTLLGDRERLAADLLRAGERMLRFYVPYAVVILLTLALRLIPSVDAHSLTSVLVFGPLTLLRPFVAAAGVALGAAAAPRPAVFTIGALVLGMMLSMERFLSRQAAREAASHRTSTMSNQGRSSWT